MDCILPTDLENTHRYPGHIVTSHLAVFKMEIDKQKNVIDLYCSYGDLVRNETFVILVETDVEMFERILAKEEDQMNGVLEYYFSCLENNKADIFEIDFEEYGPMVFSEHIFGLNVVAFMDEVTFENERQKDHYQIVCALEIKLFDFFYFIKFPTCPAEWQKHYHKLLVIKYMVYIEYRRKMGMRKALLLSGMDDPLIYKMSKLLYQMMGEEEIGNSDIN
jgi:hypothetical protein